MRASTELDNLLEVSNYIKSEADDRGHIFAKNGWDYYEIAFKVGDKTYTGLLNIANGEKGKLLYDITNIKEKASNYSVKTVSDTSSSSNNSILPTQKNVNDTTKYSKQKYENNSGSFNLSDNNIQDKKSSNKSSFSIEDINSNVDKLNSDSKNKTINKLTKEF